MTQTPPHTIKAALIGALLLIVALAGFGIDYSFYRMYAAKLGQDGSVAAYSAHRFGGGGDNVFEATTATFDPIGVSDPRVFAKNITAVYPAAFGDWTKRSFREADFWRIRPDLAHCDGLYHRPSMMDAMAADEDRTNGCPLEPQKAGRSVVYQKGSTVAVMYAYFEGRGGYKKMTTRGKPTIVSHAFGADYYNHRHPEFFRNRGVLFERFPRQREASGKVERLPTRVFGWRKEKRGVFRVFVVTNGSTSDARALLMRMDFRVVDGLFAEAG